jgi:flagellin
MSLVIANNVASLNAQNNLSRTSSALNKSLERLSSGFKVNRGADGPAALVISEKQRAQIAGLNQAISNSEKAVSMVQTAEGALNEINSLLVKVRSLAIDSANAGVNDADALAANQAEIDNALDTIDRIANNTQFSTKKLLDGSLSSGKVLNAGVSSFSQSGLAAGSYGVAFGGAFVVSDVTEDMTDAEATALTDAADSDNLIAGSQFTSSGTLSVQDGGSNTLVSVTYAATDTLGAKLAELQTAADNADVGVDIDFTAGGGVADSAFGLTAQDFGDYADDYDLQISDGSTTFDTTGGTATGATVQTMTGTLVDNAGAMTQVGNRGNQFQNASGSVSITLTGSSMTTPISTTTAVEAQNGAVFQIGANQNQTASIAIGAATTSDLGILGGASLADLATGGSRTVVAGQAQNALGVIDKAIDNVTNLRGNLGAFQQNTLESTANNLRATLENTVQAESVIRDTDFAQEIAEFTKQQILAQAGTSVLANANQTPQLVLSLLG